MDGPDRGRSGLDRFVQAAIDRLGALGLNTTRLRWRWHRLRDRIAERRREAANRARAVTGRHRMCPACRALVPTGAGTCTECGASLAGAPRPGPARLIAWLLPGVPVASALIVTANFAIFLLIAARAGFAPGHGGLFGILAFSGDTLIRYGSGAPFLLLLPGGTARFLSEEWWRLVCPVFLHGGLLHLLMNTFLLVQIGPFLEGEYGKEKFFALYLWCGVAGFVASEMLRLWAGGGFVNTVGASGAIFGLVGAALVYGARRGGPFGRQLRALMTRWAIYLAIWTFLVPGIDAWAHFGGLAAGAAFAAATRPAPASGRALAAWRAAALAGAGLVLIAFLLAGRDGQASLDLLRSLRG